MSSFYWFDYETFGINPAWDRPCQFAGIRTDEELNEIDEPLELFCRQSMDYLPSPMACKVTGLSPQQVNAKGLSEKQFIQRVVEQLGAEGTCSVGYNSISFDDEFTRHTLFRNFHDAYEYEYKDKNSRWDLLGVVRLTRALRPEGINWPFIQADGAVSDTPSDKPSNKLEHLSAVNDIEHGNAHDALSDVRATIDMARLIRDKQPKLFKYAFENRGKQAVLELLNTKDPKMCLQVSGTIDGSRSHLAVILPLTGHETNRNSVVVLDLHQDPTPLLSMDADEIRAKVFQKNEDTQDLDRSSGRPGLRTVQINKCPVIVPLKSLRPEDAERLGIDLEQVKAHEREALKLLQKDKLAAIQKAFSGDWGKEDRDVEGTLYSGAFLSRQDKELATKLRNCEPESILETAAEFQDERLVELAWRYFARNYSEHLNEEQRTRWQKHCRDRLTSKSAHWLTFARFDEEMASLKWDAKHEELKFELNKYVESVKNHAQYAED